MHGAKKIITSRRQGNASRFLQAPQLAVFPAVVIVANSRITIEVDASRLLAEAMLAGSELLYDKSRLQGFQLIAEAESMQ